MADLANARAELLEAMQAAQKALDAAELGTASLSTALVQLDKAVVIAGEVRKQIRTAMLLPPTK